MVEWSGVWSEWECGVNGRRGRGGENVVEWNGVWHVFEIKPRKFGDAKISHYTVLYLFEKSKFLNKSSLYFLL